MARTWKAPKGPLTCSFAVGDTGFEPVTLCVLPQLAPGPFTRVTLGYASAGERVRSWGADEPFG